MNSERRYSELDGYRHPDDVSGSYQADADASQESSLPRRWLWIAVVMLGLAVLILGTASRWGPTYSVRIGVLAALVAALGLLGGQGERGWLVVVLAIAGFLDAVNSRAAVDQGGWVPTAIMVLTALQSLAAVAALLIERPEARAQSSPEATYSAYLGYLQAYYYAAQFQQPAPPQQPPSAHQADGFASAVSEMPAREAGRQDEDRAAAEDASFAALQAKYAQYGTPRADPPASASEIRESTDYPGMPDVDQRASGERPYPSSQRYVDPGSPSLGQP